MTDVYERVVRVLQEDFDVIDIAPEMILERFNMDSLDVVELAMDLEEEFDMDIPDTTWETSGISSDTTIQQFVDCVQGWYDGHPFKLKPIPPEPHLPWQEVGF